ncbi:ECF transporter S component [Haloimpatiens sp. FM7330]|uniref:ECF transporter S component n=1 Tax=Haloimpatiens sp. FM7330 TaxID=3298610 RepID=UPI003645B643
MKKSKLNKQIKISLLAVIAFLLMFIEVPIPIFPDFLKIDISDLPALLGAFTFGPIAGVVVEFFKNLLHGIFVGKTAFIGELSNFIGGSVLVIIAGSIYKFKKDKKGAIIALISGSIVMSLVAGILNYYIYLPLYEKVLGFPINAIIGMGSKVNPKVVDLKTLIVWSIIPFNLLKGFVVCIVTRVVYKSLSPILHKEEVKVVEEKKSLNYK